MFCCQNVLYIFNMAKDILLTEVPRGAKDMTGYVGGRLTILGIHSKHISEKGGQFFRWHARCTCGNKVVINGQHFSNGSIRSCGCLNKERSSIRCQMTPMRTSSLPCSPPPMRITPDELVKMRHRHITSLTGKTCGTLTVGQMTFAMVYWLRHKRPTRKTDRKDRKDKMPLVMHIVTTYMCRCSCGNSVERSSNYLRLKKIVPTCQTCRRNPAIMARSAKRKGAPS